MANIDMKTVKRSQIKVDKRFREDYGDLSDLATSMKIDGIIQPLAVKCDGDDCYILLAGGRRMKAAEKAGIDDIPVRIYPADLDVIQMRVIELSENIYRKDMSWLEQTRLRKEIHELQLQIHGKKISTSPDAKGWSQPMSAQMMGITQPMMSVELKLADAIEAFPALQQAKTREEALKMMKKLGETMIRSELGKRLAAQQANTPAEQQQSNLTSRYIVMDFFEFVKKIPDNSIDFCEIDPPYAIDLMELKKKRDISQYNEEAYNEVDQQDYLHFLERTVAECHRVMTDSSWLVMWFAIEPWIEDIYQILSKQGFAVRRLVGIWAKDQGQTMNPAMHLGNQYEPFFYARKGNASIMKQGRGNIFNYKTVTPTKKIHPTERPIEMIQDLISTFCWEGSRILVPFLGSGNTLLAAANLNLTAFGTDLSQEYKDAYTVRVYSGKPGEYKSY